MKRYMRISIVFFIISISTALSANQVEINGLDTTKSGDPLILPATLTKPEGKGPFPAVIMLHHCKGNHQYLNPWESRFISWGYVVLRVDSQTPRQMESLCSGRLHELRAQDAYDAKSYLMQVSFIDKDKIAVVGWGHGGTAALVAIDDSSEIKNRGAPFRAAVAFYPYPVYDIRKQNAPLLALMGEKDQSVSPVILKTTLSLSKSPFETELKIYENAGHLFDWEGYNEVSALGRKRKWSPEATKAAILDLKKFLSKWLK